MCNHWKLSEFNQLIEIWIYICNIRINNQVLIIIQLYCYDGCSVFLRQGSPTPDLEGWCPLGFRCVYHSESFRCSLANFGQACTCAFLSRWTLRALKDFNPLWCNVFPVVFLVTVVPATLRLLISSFCVVPGWFLTFLSIIGISLPIYRADTFNFFYTGLRQIFGLKKTIKKIRLGTCLASCSHYLTDSRTLILWTSPLIFYF